MNKAGLIVSEWRAWENVQPVEIWLSMRDTNTRDREAEADTDTVGGVIVSGEASNVIVHTTHAAAEARI